MNRRTFLRDVSAAAIAVASGREAVAFAEGASVPEAGWRTYEVTTSVEVLRPVGETRVWVPVALGQETPFQRVLTTHVECETGEATVEQSGAEDVGCVRAHFRPGVRPVLKVTSRVATRDWRVDVGVGDGGTARESAKVRRYLEPTAYVPTTGIVKQKADEITRGAGTDVEKVRSIYAWVVENTYRDPKVRGCGRGDIRAMLETGNLGGKCADLNALFVGLVRASGVPARDMYGVRVGPSQQGFKCLGTKTEDSTKAQHCRAEVCLQSQGWVPMDPADVRKVMLEEPRGGLPLGSDEVQRARLRMFGGWEMNWMAYN